MCSFAVVLLKSSVFTYISPILALPVPQETPAPGTSEAKQWEEDWDDAGWDDEDQDT